MEQENQSEGLFLRKEDVKMLSRVLVFAKNRIISQSKLPEVDPMRAAKLLLFCECMQASCNGIIRPEAKRPRKDA